MTEQERRRATREAARAQHAGACRPTSRPAASFIPMAGGTGRWAERDVVAMGGPPKLFEEAGREQLIVLLEHGLTFDSRVVDIGCGALRGGRWVMRLLDPGCYFGLDSDEEQVRVGLERFVPAEVVAEKHPHFAYNADFDLAGFDTTFTHFLLRSVWTHCAKRQIEQSLDAFVKWGDPDAILLASVWFPQFTRRRPFYRPDYKGEEWVGRDHRAKVHGGVAHSWRWIKGAASARGLMAVKIDRPPVNRQRWVTVRRT
jgi:SAM-dependent methyltransferase